MLSRKAVVEHQGIAGEDHIGDNGKLFQHLVKTDGPGYAELQVCVGLQAGFHVSGRYVLIKDRADDPGPQQSVPVFFKGGAPVHAQGVPQIDRSVICPAMSQHFFPEAEHGEGRRQNALVGAVAKEQCSVGIVAPGKDLCAAADELLEEVYVLLNIHKIVFLSCEESGITLQIPTVYHNSGNQG